MCTPSVSGPVELRKSNDVALDLLSSLWAVESLTSGDIAARGSECDGVGTTGAGFRHPAVACGGGVIREPLDPLV